MSMADDSHHATPAAAGATMETRTTSRPPTGIDVPEPGMRPSRPDRRRTLHRWVAAGTLVGTTLATVATLGEAVTAGRHLAIAILAVGAVALVFGAAGGVFGGVIGAINWLLDLWDWSRTPAAPPYSEQYDRLRQWQTRREPYVRPVLYAIVTLGVLVYAAHTGDVDDLLRGAITDQPLPALAAYAIGVTLVHHSVVAALDAVDQVGKAETTTRLELIDHLDKTRTRS